MHHLPEQRIIRRSRRQAKCSNITIGDQQMKPYEWTRQSIRDLEGTVQTHYVARTKFAGAEVEMELIQLGHIRSTRWHLRVEWHWENGDHTIETPTDETHILHIFYPVVTSENLAFSMAEARIQHYFADIEAMSVRRFHA